eukprot:TRINITY_DN20217_c0_g2_i1.p1 TRINITY_DN20217_c0_g2~~TRINITY_DN20217_c0_g2_i1.p1  ORF type:complete len:1226 (+),score=309.78 TRINITY_DN20217_c0_g2_i1:74-3751(+)
MASSPVSAETPRQARCSCGFLHPLALAAATGGGSPTAMQQRLQEADEENRRQRLDLEEQAQEVADLRAEIARLRAELGRARQLCEELGRHAHALQHECRELAIARAEAHEAAKQMQVKLDEMNWEVATWRKEAKDAQARVAESQEKHSAIVDDLQRQIARLSIISPILIDSSEPDSLKESPKGPRRESSPAATDFFQKRVSELELQLRTTEASKAAFQTRLEDAHREISAQNAEVRSLRALLSQAETDRDSVAAWPVERETLREEAQALNSKIEALLGRLGNMEQECTGLRHQLAQELATREALEANAKQLHDAHSREIAQLQAAIEQRTSQAQDAEEKLHAANEELQSYRTQKSKHTIEAELGVLKEEIVELQFRVAEEELGRSRDRENLQAREAELREVRLLLQTAEADRDRLEESQRRPNETWSSMEGALHARIAAIGGDRERLQVLLEAEQERCRELLERLDSAERETSQIQRREEANSEELRAIVDSCRAELRVKVTEGSSLAQRLAAAEQARDELTAELHEQQRRTTAKDEELDLLVQEFEMMKQDRNRMEAEATQLREEQQRRSSKEEIIGRKEQEAVGLRHVAQLLQEQLEGLHRQLKGSEAHRDELQSHLDRRIRESLQEEERHKQREAEWERDREQAAMRERQLERELQAERKRVADCLRDQRALREESTRVKQESIGFLRELQKANAELEIAADLRSELDQKELEITRLRNVSQELLPLRAKLDEQLVLCSKLKSAKEELEASRRKLEERLEDSVRNAANTEELMQRLRKQVDERERELQQLPGLREQLRRAQEQVEERASQLSSLQRQLEKHLQAAAESRREHERLSELLVQRNAAAAQLQRQVAEREAETLRIEAMRHQLQREVEDLRHGCNEQRLELESRSLGTADLSCNAQLTLYQYALAEVNHLQDVERLTRENFVLLFTQGAPKPPARTDDSLEEQRLRKELETVRAALAESHETEGKLTRRCEQFEGIKAQLRTQFDKHRLENEQLRTELQETLETNAKLQQQLDEQNEVCDTYETQTKSMLAKIKKLQDELRRRDRPEPEHGGDRGDRGERGHRVENEALQARYTDLLAETRKLQNYKEHVGALHATDIERLRREVAHWRTAEQQLRAKFEEETQRYKEQLFQLKAQKSELARRLEQPPPPLQRENSQQSVRGRAPSSGATAAPQGPAAWRRNTADAHTRSSKPVAARRRAPSANAAARDGGSPTD